MDTASRGQSTGEHLKFRSLGTLWVEAVLNSFSEKEGSVRLRPSVSKEFRPLLYTHTQIGGREDTEILNALE